MFIEKTYKFAGTSIVEGIKTYRFCNNSAEKRVKVLENCGHTEPVFHSLPRAMVLKDAVAWLRTQGIEAVLPHGQRRGLNGRQEGIELPVRAVAAEQHDAHVQTHAAWLAAEAERKAAFVARMAAARAAKKAAAVAA